MKSRIDSPLPGRLTRRIATVTTWAPDASWASRMVSFEEYLPVPTISRDENSLPPITRFVSYIANLPFFVGSPRTAGPQPRDVLRLALQASPHGANDFHAVPFTELHGSVLALRRDLAVHR